MCMHFAIKAQTSKDPNVPNDEIIATTTNLRKVLGTGGDDEELLEGKLVAGVLTAVDDVEAGDGESIRGGVAGNIGVVLPEGNTLGGGAGLGGGEGDCAARARSKGKVEHMIHV